MPSDWLFGLNGLDLGNYISLRFILVLLTWQDEKGNKMINEYVREYKIGSGSYGKVVRMVL